MGLDADNPWLHVPLADYEGHMTAPGVEQLELLADLFGCALSFCTPQSVAVLGVAGGNGLDRVHPATVRRVVGIDIHPQYLAESARRYPHLSLELRCFDLSSASVAAIEPVDLVHAALILEHAGTDWSVEHAVRLVRPGGFLCVVLQCPSDLTADVAPTPFATIQMLSEDFALVDIEVLTAHLSRKGLRIEHELTRAAAGGKAMCSASFDVRSRNEISDQSGNGAAVRRGGLRITTAAAGHARGSEASLR